MPPRDTLPLRLGTSTAEYVKNGAWHGPGSAPSWIIGTGHVDKAEARRLAADEVTEREDHLDAAMAKAADAEREAKNARSAADRAHTGVLEARESLARAQRDLARRCAFEAQETPPGSPVAP